MGIRVNLNGWQIARQLHEGDRRLFSSMEKLASGLAINRASDGPAMLIISEQLRAQIASLDREIENLSMQEYKYEYASSSAMQLREKLTEMRSLAIGAANEGGNDETSQAAYDNAAQDIAASYNEAVDSAEYNGKKLFDGSADALTSISPLQGIDLSSAEGAVASVEKIDAAIAEVDQAQIEFGSSIRHEFQSQQASLAITRQNLIASESQIRDVDWAMEFSRFMAEQIQFRAGMALMAQAQLSSRMVLGLLGG